MIIWKEIDTVLLDMDGTLLDLHFDNYFWQEYLPQKWAEEKSLSIDQAKEALMPGFYRWAGTLSWYCLDHWSEHLGMDILKLKKDIGNLIRERPFALDFLKFLSETDKRIALVTNAHAGLIDMKFSCTQIGEYFEHVYCAHDFGFPKEDVEFWDVLMKEFHFTPSRTLLVDDNLNVLHSARKYGIKHLLSISQPDSHKPPRDITEFPVVDSFEDLIIRETV